MRVGIVGGTFDPIHLGHLIAAEEARVSQKLEEVIFIPTGHPWMKADHSLSAPHHRVNMARLAIASNPFFRVSSQEVDRLGPTYTVDTIEELQKECGGEDQFCFILGYDALKKFHCWKEPKRILELCTLIAVARRGSPDLDLGQLAKIAPATSDRVVCLEGPLVDISGTEIRRRVALGVSVRYQVPDAVERYLVRYGLYRDSGTS